MANKKISEFPVITTPAGNAAFLVNHLGSTSTVSFSSLSSVVSNDSIKLPSGATGGQVLTYNGSTSTWVASAAPKELPQTASTGQVLTYDGGTSAWVAVGTGASLKTWVNFNGTNTVSIRGSANVSSITDNGTGDYTVNFTTAMPDANFAVLCTADGTTGVGWTEILPPALGGEQTASSIRVGFRGTTAYGDTSTYCVAVFR